MTPTACIVCDASTVSALDLGMQPLANALLKNQTDDYAEFPLGITYCPSCSHAQLTHFVAPESLFTDYLYASGTSQTMQNYFAWFAKKIRYELNGEFDVLEIASNDGSLLDKLSEQGFSVMGIDPASNLCAIAKAKGHEIMCSYFPNTKLIKQFSIIVAVNVFAHNPAPLQFMQGVANHLKPNGTCIIQTSQALMLASGEFDTIYHEHYSFFTVRSLRELAKRGGLTLAKIELSTIHGVSLLFYLRHQNAAPLPKKTYHDNQFSAQSHLHRLPFYQRADEDIDKIYSAYVLQAENRMHEVNEKVMAYRRAGYKIALVGVAAKSLTFVRATNLNFDGSFDEATLKIGKFIPAFDHPIQPFNEIKKLGNKVLIIIGAWNFSDEISVKVKQSNAETELKFLTYFPAIREF